jgi:hypothetical protein
MVTMALYRIVIKRLPEVFNGFNHETQNARKEKQPQRAQRGRGRKEEREK